MVIFFGIEISICRKAGRLKINFEMFQKSFNNVFRRVCFDVFFGDLFEENFGTCSNFEKTAIRNILSLRCMFFAKLCFMKHPCSDMKRSCICMKHPFPGMYEKMYVFFEILEGFAGPKFVCRFACSSKPMVGRNSYVGDQSYGW